LALLAAILLASGVMLLVCVAVGLLISLNTFAFMAAEVFIFTDIYYPNIFIVFIF